MLRCVGTVSSKTGVGKRGGRGGCWVTDGVRIQSLLIITLPSGILLARCGGQAWSLIISLLLYLDSNRICPQLNQCGLTEQLDHAYYSASKLAFAPRFFYGYLALCLEVTWILKLLKPKVTLGARGCFQGPKKRDAILYFRIPHNSICLPPKFCITNLFSNALGNMQCPKSIGK